MHSHAAAPFPRAPLVAAAALIVLSIAAAAFVRTTGIGRDTTPDAAPAVQRHLRFDDRADGSITVTDAVTARAIAIIEPGTDGFLRGTLRGLARERKREGIGADAPFDLVARADGRLTLLDTATGRRVDLESFGPTNAGAFARLLDTNAGAR